MRIAFVLLAVIGFHSTSVGQSLQNYCEQAAKNNPGLLAKYAVFEAALTRTSQVNALPDPSLSLGVFVSPVETRVGPQRARISLTQMFPWFGTLADKENAAALKAEAAYQEFINARGELFYKVAAAYYPLYEQEELVQLERNNIEILNSYKKLGTIQYENGKGAMTDVLRVDILLNEANIRLDLLEEIKFPLAAAFNRILNRPDSTPINLPDSLPFTPYSNEQLADSTFQNHPTISKLQKLEQASLANKEVARKMGYPSFGVGLDYAIVSKRDDMNLTDNGKDIIMPMVSLSIPVYRNKIVAAQKEAELTAKSFQQQQQEATNQLQIQYQWAVYRAMKKTDLLNLYKRQIEESKRIERLLTVAYGNSDQDFEEVLRIQQQVLQYERLYITTLTELCTTMAEIDYLTTKTE